VLYLLQNSIDAMLLLHNTVAMQAMANSNDEQDTSGNEPDGNSATFQGYYIKAHYSDNVHVIIIISPPCSKYSNKDYA